MIRRIPAIVLLATTVAFLVAACNGTSTAPPLTDPTEIVTAALKSTEVARSVHVDVAVDGKATVSMPGAGGLGLPVNLAGTTASADIDFAKSAGKANISVPALLNFAAELIAVDGKVYTKTTLGGPLYQVSDASEAPVDLSDTRGMIDNLGDLLLKKGVTLVKGEDVACGSRQCYTVSTDLTAAQLGAAGAGALSSLPVDLTGASLKVTVQVEKDLPHHLAGVTAILTLTDGSVVTAELRASKWDEPVSVSAPPAYQVKPAS